MREEATRMTALETSLGANPLRGIGAVVAAHPGETVVINGNFCQDPNNVPPRQTTHCVGRLISGGALSTVSISKAIGNVTPNQQQYIGQTAAGAFVFNSGDVPLNTYKEAMGGLLPGRQGTIANREDKAIQTIGEAHVGTHGVIFILSTDMNVDPSGNKGDGSVGSFTDAVASGASRVLVMDGSSSVGVAYETPSGTLTTQFKGSKHNGFPYYINTYLMFECQKP